MKKIIAKKKHSAGVMFILLTLLGVGLLILGIAFDIKILLFMGAVFAVGCVGFVVWYFTVPSEIITLDENRNLILPKGVVIPLRDITEVSSFEAWNHRTKYTWGTVTIETKTRKYKYGFVADCAEVEKRLNDLRRGKKVKFIEKKIGNEKNKEEIQKIFDFLIENYDFQFSVADLGNAVDANGKFFFYGPVYCYSLWNGKVCINILELVQRQDFNIYITRELTQDQPIIRSGIAVENYLCYHWEELARQIKQELKENETIYGISAK